jgi:hypothetical protein
VGRHGHRLRPAGDHHGQRKGGGNQGFAAFHRRRCDAPAELGIGEGFGLVLDLGCLHGIPENRRDAYAAGVTAATIPGADFLVWGFYAPPSFVIRVKLTREDVERHFGNAWEIVRAWGGEQPGRFRGGWYHLKKRAG